MYMIQWTLVITNFLGPSEITFLYSIKILLSPPNEVREGDYETGSVYTCVCVCVSVRPDSKCLNLLLLCHFLADFDSVCFI